jgi:hypothetical protein
MFASGTAMPASAVNSYLVNEITFLHWSVFCNEWQRYLQQFQFFMNYISIIAIISVLAIECNKKIEIPVCIEQRIEQIRSQPKTNPPMQINEYEYMGQRTFLFSAPCCDFYAELYDENCTYVCAPSGGLTGKGDGKCSDFTTVAKHIRLIWKDER